MKQGVELVTLWEL